MAWKKTHVSPKKEREKMNDGLTVEKIDAVQGRRKGSSKQRGQRNFATVRPMEVNQSDGEGCEFSEETRKRMDVMTRQQKARHGVRAVKGRRRREKKKKRKRKKKKKKKKMMMMMMMMMQKQKAKKKLTCVCSRDPVCFFPSPCLL